MAEALVGVGIVANFAGVIGASLTLSKSLYDFAHVVGSATGDVKSLATDVSLFCAVLKQVQSTLSQAKAYRMSMSAMDTAQAITNRCEIIFDDLDKAITKLQGGKSKPDFMSRVKWYFQEKRFAQKIASDRHSITNHDEEDAQDRLMTNSLFMAQQTATERLAAVELQSSDDDDTIEFNPTPLTPAELLSPTNTQLRHRRNRSSQIIAGSVHSVDSTFAWEARPVSAILEGHINRLSLVESVRYSHIPALDDRRLSILQTDELLRQWTDQTDPLAAYASEMGSEDIDAPQMHRKLTIRVADAGPESWMPQVTPDSNAEDEESTATPTHTFQETPTIYLTPSEIRQQKGWCFEIIPRILQSHRIIGDWRTWALIITDIDGAFEVGPQTMPFTVFEHVQLKGTLPGVMLQKRPSTMPLSKLPLPWVPKASVLTRKSGAALEHTADQEEVERNEEGTVTRTPLPQEAISVKEAAFRRDPTSNIEAEYFEHSHNRKSITEELHTLNFFDGQGFQVFGNFPMGLTILAPKSWPPPCKNATSGLILDDRTLYISYAARLWPLSDQKSFHSECSSGLLVLERNQSSCSGSPVPLSPRI